MPEKSPEMLDVIPNPETRSNQNPSPETLVCLKGLMRQTDESVSVPAGQCNFSESCTYYGGRNALYQTEVQTGRCILTQVDL